MCIKNSFKMGLIILNNKLVPLKKENVMQLLDYHMPERYLSIQYKILMYTVKRNLEYVCDDQFKFRMVEEQKELPCL